MSSAPIGENSVVSSAIVVTPCPLLKVPADHNPFYRNNMMPPGEALVYGIYCPSHGPFLDQLRRTHLLRASVNRSLSADAPGLRWHHGSGSHSRRSWAGEERPYVCGQTPPDHHVLHLNLRAHVFGGVGLIRRGRLAHSLLHGRAAARRPHRDPHHPGLGGAARSWLSNDPLARGVVLVRGGQRTPACGPPSGRGAERRTRGGSPVASPARPLV